MKFAFLRSNRMKIILGGSVLLSLVVGFLCISFIHALSVHASAGPGHVTHASHEVSVKNCCDVEMGDHMELWKSTLVGIPQGFQNLLMLFVVVAATSLVFTGFLKIPRLDINILFYRYRQYAREHPNILSYNHLRLAFARGILHPKLF